MTPLLVPKITPNNWDEWWDIWNKHSDLVTKAHQNHNDYTGQWRGLDIFTRLDIKNIYSAPQAPESPVITDLIRQIETHIPIILTKVRVIENLEFIPAHSDHHYGKDEIRCFLWNNYEKPVWSFEYENESKQLVLPNDTNCFYYKDYPMKHSSIYERNFSKGIMAIYGIPKLAFRNFVESSSLYYKNHAWEV